MLPDQHWTGTGRPNKRHTTSWRQHRGSLQDISRMLFWHHRKKIDQMGTSCTMLPNETVQNVHWRKLHMTSWRQHRGSLQDISRMMFWHHRKKIDQMGTSCTMLPNGTVQNVHWRKLCRKPCPMCGDNQQGKTCNLNFLFRLEIFLKSIFCNRLDH